MKRSRAVRFLVATPFCALLALASVRAEDTKGKWQFGFGLSYFSTVDYIRSNADVAIASGLAGQEGLPAVTFVDPRPDANILNRPGVQDDFKLDFNVSYGLTRWLAVELAASYLKAPVGNIEVFSIDVVKDVGNGFQNPTFARVCGPQGQSLCFNYRGDTISSRSDSNEFLQVGELTEIPIQLSALVRFRPESPFDPYVGLGVGYIMTDLKTGDSFEAQAKEVSELLVQAPILGNAVADPAFTSPFPGITPGPLEAEVNDAFEYHVVGGVDYYLSERFSMFVDARYVWTSGAVDIRIWDAQQGLLTSTELGKLRVIQEGLLEDRDGDGEFDPKLFLLWEDLGTVDNAAFIGTPGNPSAGRCSKAQGADIDCQGSGLFEMDDFNGNGLYEADTEGTGVLFQLPPGSADPGERLGEILCPACRTVDNGGPAPVPPLYVGSSTARVPANTEDTNFSRSLDRFKKFGVDCSTVAPGTYPECGGILQTPGSRPQFVWPEGCTQLSPNLPLAATTAALQEGCPVPRSTNVNVSGVDNIADTLLIQGGEIRLGGFSLGVGVKFTF